MIQSAQSPSESRQRVLDAAAKLFAARGYSSVTLRDIADELGIRQASLYYHAPGGKAELFAEVTARHLQQHREGLTSAMCEAGETIREKLYAASRWFLSQPPMDLLRMTYSDMPELDAQKARQLSEIAFASVILPLHQALVEAEAHGELTHPDLGLMAGGLLGMLQSLHSVPEYVFEESSTPIKPRQQMAYELIDVMLRGLRPVDGRE